MQLYVDYLREINHPDAEKRAAMVESLRANLPSPPQPSAAPSPPPTPNQIPPNT